MHIFQRKIKQGGGIIVYIKNHIDFKNVKLQQDYNTESVWIDINLIKEEWVRLGIFYRPPDNSEYLNDIIIENINESIDNLGLEKPVIILGDFNLSNINWDNLKGSNSTEDKFINCFQNNFLEQLVNFKTRGNNILDLILTNHSELINNIHSYMPLGNSDHSGICFEIYANLKHKENNEKVFNFRKGNYNKFRELLSLINWEDVFRDKTCSEMWAIFKDIIEKIQLECIPKIKLRASTNKKPGWWTSEIQRTIKDKENAYKDLINSNYNIIQLDVFRSIRNKLNKLIKKNKRLEQIKISKEIKNPKKFFSYFNSKKKFKSIIKLIRKDNEIAYNDNHIVEIFNNYFSSIFNNKNGNDKVKLLDNIEGHLINNIEINKNIICKYISSLDIGKAAGPDGLSARILKEGMNSISTALDIIFRKSLCTSEVPEDWTIANVTPVYKNGCRESVENYRPISLTSVVCRLLERIIKDSFVSCLQECNIINNSQHGFMKGRSCLTNLLEYINYVTEQVDCGNAVDVIYLDFAKAFDKVCHVKLISKLQSLGIGGNLLSWIRNWLNNRKQRVVLNGIKSDWMNVESGVPQGSVLGPLLFVLYINDLEIGLGSKVWKFADDTKIVRSIKSINDNCYLQKDLDRLQNWANENQMEFNVKKCKVMHIGNNNIRFNYEMSENWLDECWSERDLGIKIDSNMNFSGQSLEARNKANRMLGFIGRNVTYKSKEVVRRLYNSYVRPHLEYSVQAWRPHLRKDISMLEAVQRRATRMVPCLRKLDYKDRLKELNLYSVERRYMRGDMIEVYKILNGIDSIRVNEFFEMFDRSITRGNSYKIKMKHSRLDMRKYSFALRVVGNWNSLSDNAVTSQSLDVFKSRLDKEMDRWNYVN